jgi:hypothetical protein
MWQKTYRISLGGTEVAPSDVVSAWKEKFSDFWPANSRFFAPLAGIAPGEVAALDLGMPGGLKLSTGVLVLFSDEESFTLMTPEGHMFAGWITFSAHEENGATVAQAQVLMRAQDPLTELGLTFGGHRKEDQFWCGTLRSLAGRFGVAAEPEAHAVCVDKRRQWARAGNVRHSAAFRSGSHTLTSPMRKLTTH